MRVPRLAGGFRVGTARSRAWGVVWLLALVAYTSVGPEVARSRESSPPIVWEKTGFDSFTVRIRAPRDGTYVGWYSQILANSTDGGMKWTRRTDVNSPFIHALDVDPADSARIFAGRDDGFFRSTDGGVSWTKVLELPPDEETKDQAGTVVRRVYDTVRAISVSPVDPSLVYASVTNQTWTKSPTGNGGSTTNNSVRTQRSRDGGDTWEEIDQMVAAGDCRPYAALLHADPLDARRVYSARQCQPGGPSASGLSVSVDQGASWRLVSPESGAVVARLSGGEAGSERRLYADANLYQKTELFLNRRLYRSDDGGETWQPISLPFSMVPTADWDVVGLVQHPADAQHIWVLMEAPFNRKIAPQLMESRDGGQNWTLQAFPEGYRSTHLVGISLDGRYLFATEWDQGLMRGQIP
ncbi:MAG: sialidase family protein [Chloroflexota bacterium]